MRRERKVSRLINVYRDNPDKEVRGIEKRVLKEKKRKDDSRDSIGSRPKEDPFKSPERGRGTRGTY